MKSPTALFDNGAITHHHYAVGKLLHHAKIVAYEQARKTIPFL